MKEIAAYWDRQPCGSTRSKAVKGTLEWSWDVTENRHFVQPHIIDFANFPWWSGQRILEIGCGIGTDTLEFATFKAVVDAVDVSEESIRLAEHRCALHNLDPWNWPTFYNVNAEEWLPTGPYDLIYSFGVLHHTPEPERALKLAFDRTRPGGELRIMLYAKWSLKLLLREQPEAQVGCPLVRWYTVREARALVEGAGYAVESVEKTHIFPWRVADYTEGRYVKRALYRWMPDWLFGWLEHRLGHHLLIKAVKRA